MSYVMFEIQCDCGEIHEFDLKKDVRPRMDILPCECGSDLRRSKRFWLKSTDGSVTAGDVIDLIIGIEPMEEGKYLIENYKGSLVYCHEHVRYVEGVTASDSVSQGHKCCVVGCNN